jgi:VanZ family protein
MSTTSSSPRKRPTIASNNAPLAARRRPWIRRSIRWATTICWAGLIYHLSTEGFGSSFTELWLRQVLAFFRLDVSPATLHLLNFAVRKLAHLTEYAIFAQLLYVTLLGAEELEWQPRRAFWSALIAAGYSLTDEFHQVFVPNRTASLADCALDTTGATFGLFVANLTTRLLQANKRRAAAREGITVEK